MDIRAWKRGLRRFNPEPAGGNGKASATAWAALALDLRPLSIWLAILFVMSSQRS